MATGGRQSTVWARRKIISGMLHITQKKGDIDRARTYSRYADDELDRYKTQLRYAEQADKKTAQYLKWAADALSRK